MAARETVLARYRELLRLISRLPADRRASAHAEATAAVRERMRETDAERAAQYHKELVAKIGYLRMITPRQPSDSPKGGRYVLRDGELVQAEEDKPQNGRAANGALTMDEAQKLNARDFQRLYGRRKSGSTFF